MKKEFDIHKTENTMPKTTASLKIGKSYLPQRLQRGADLIDLHLDDGALLALAGGVRALLKAALRNDAHALGEGLGHVLGRLAPDRAAHEERLGVLLLIGLAVEDAGRRGDREGRDRRTRGGEAHLGVRGDSLDRKSVV